MLRVSDDCQFLIPACIWESYRYPESKKDFDKGSKHMCCI